MNAGRKVRENYLPLPGKQEGYARVLLVGTTGAGKTSLLRQLIGTDPDRERFPSTSTAKTTTADIEIVTRPSAFESVVTFSPLSEVRANIEECVVAAARAVVKRVDGPEVRDSDVADLLLNHKDQRFRLSYVLGSLQDDDDDDEMWCFGGEPEHEEPIEASDGRLAQYSEVIQSFVDSVREQVLNVEGRLWHELDATKDELGEDDRAAFEELFESELRDSNEFIELCDAIVEEVKARFDNIALGTLHRSDDDDWPTHWLFESDERTEAIEAIRWFSSNYAPRFGELVTPLVDGIRAAGPFFPKVVAEQPKLVFIDGEGLGHSASTAASVSTKISSLFEQVDKILLVDNAQNPIQAAPLAVMRTILASGYQKKLLIAFTHLDLVRGDNLRTQTDVRKHVLGSVGNGLRSMEGQVAASAKRGFEREMESRCYMFGILNKPYQQFPAGQNQHFQGLFSALSVESTSNMEIHPKPEYDLDAIPLAASEASTNLVECWKSILRTGERMEGAPPVHWSKIKALNRRIVLQRADEYDGLRPVADYLMFLQAAFGDLIESPGRWSPQEPSDTEREEVLDTLRQAVFSRLSALVEERLIERQSEEWRSAYELRGTGSTSVRAKKLTALFSSAAPCPETRMTNEASRFTFELRELFVGALSEVVGERREDEASPPSPAESYERAS